MPKSSKKSRKLRGGKLIGSGGYGCVFSPAIVLPGSVITKENNELYASKVHSDPDDEYNNTLDIIKLLEDFEGIDAFGPESPGWFPIEMHCFHLDTSLKAKTFLSELDFAAAESECDNVIDKIFNDKDKKKNKRICVVQSLKFSLTLYDLIEKGSKKSILNQLFQESRKKLNILHMLHIYQLDIKEENMAINETDKGLNIFFTDWDLSFVERKCPRTLANGYVIQTKEEDYNEKISFIIDNSDYYFVHRPELLLINNGIDSDEANEITDFILYAYDIHDYSGTPINRRKVLTYVDRYMFMGMWHRFYSGLTHKEIMYKIENGV